MPDNENRSAYIGLADCPRPVPVVLVNSLWIVAILLAIAAIVCSIIRYEAIISALFLILGPSLLIGYLEMRNKRAAYSRYTNGRVVDKVVEMHGHTCSVLPIIEYEADGKTYRAKGNLSNRDYVIGEEAWVYFNPNNPQQATQEFAFTRKITPILGSITWGVGVILLVSSMII